MRLPSAMPRKTSLAAPSVRSVVAATPGRQTAMPSPFAKAARACGGRLRRADGGGSDGAPEPTPGAQILDWWRRNGPPAPEVVADKAWQSLPPNVRQTYAGIPQTVAEFSPGAAIRDVVNESGNLSRSFMSADPKGMLNAAGGMGLAALGVIPGGRLAKTVKAGDDAVAGIRAYHGSPHDFDRFDLNKIGTGEGAQAYGHGIYLAENENVARAYKNAGPAGYAAIDDINKRMSALVREMDKIGTPQYRKFTDPVLGKKLTDEYDALMAQKQNLGRMYEVRLQADRDKFLDWDKPLKEQPHVADALHPDAMGLKFRDANVPNGGPYMAFVNEANRPVGMMMKGGTQDQFLQSWQDRLKSSRTGMEFYKGLALSDKEAAAALKESGIPGIKYLDAGSRGAGTGSQNFVVFDDRIIQIMRKYGWVPAGMVAGGMMMTPPDAQAAPDDSITRTARRFGGRMKRADGGGIPFNAGLLRAARPAGGRTDTLPVDVPAGCYVIPADIVSSMGEGDTEAGRAALDQMFAGSARAARATGGDAGERVPIIAAGGEYIVHPEDVAAMGGGDMARGHNALDQFVRRQRAKTVRTLAKLPGPVK